MNIYLIGYRCTGKTSVGKSLASMIGWSFIDTDLLLVAQLGTTIAEFVHANGWTAFRRKEKAVIEKVCTLDMQVVATGGGVAQDPQNVAYMQKSGAIIWLKALPQTIKHRLIQDDNSQRSRPALTSKGRIEEIDQMLQSRNLIYEKAMNFFIETDHLSISDICNIIIEQLPKADRA